MFTHRRAKGCPFDPPFCDVRNVRTEGGLRDKMCFVEPPPAAAATKHPGQGKAPTPRSRGGFIPGLNSPDTRRRVFTRPGRRWHGLRLKTPQKHAQVVLSPVSDLI